MPRLIRAALERAGVEDAGRVSSGVDVVGDIAIVRLEDFSVSEKRKIAGALLEEFKNLRVVMEQKGGVEGEYRLRKLRHLAGENRSMTVHRENGCSFRVDVAKCYFSPRLSTERLRIAGAVKPKERVLNMFAGVGPFSIPIAKLRGAEVTSCELNEYAARLHLENDALNKVDKLIEVVNVDAADLPKTTKRKFDRVLMPLPSEADRFLSTAIVMAKKGGTIHYYRHVLGENNVEAASSLSEELRALLPPRAVFTTRRVREVGPRWVEMSAEIHTPG
ncbi:MAG TPA: class I SAM-dependent methyltransferase family protein [Nitrososphaerales archaeon]|nr:class I SAM-dependent methyltransferase family protein [Nitrososphaerales archaeon]